MDEDMRRRNDRLMADWAAANEEHRRLEAQREFRARLAHAEIADADRERRARAIACPTCQAQPGAPCTELWGRECETHAARIARVAPW